MVENFGSPNGHVYSETGVQSKTKQSDALTSDVNSIVARHIAHRIPFPDGMSRAMYGDFSDIGDFHSAVSRVRRMEDTFSRLPAHVRKHCHNDPGEFLAMVYDESRVDELVKLGLVPEVVKPAEPVVVDDPVVDPVV